MSDEPTAERLPGERAPQDAADAGPAARPRRGDVEAGGGGRRWRWNASVLVALASVAVALFYNAVQARDSARQVKLSQQSVQQTAEATQLANLLDLHAKITGAERRATSAYLAVREPGGQRRKTTELVEAITPLEGIAYALRRGLIRIPAATALWRRYLVCAFYTARRGIGPTLDAFVPELARFANTERRRLGPNRRCVQVTVP